MLMKREYLPTMEWLSFINKSITRVDLVHNKPNNQLILNILLPSHQTDRLICFIHNNMIVKRLNKASPARLSAKIT